MYNTIKILVLALVLTVSSVYANNVEVPGFSMTEVSVVDANTLKISFSKDLIEDVSMFEFLLTPKSDDTKEIVLGNLALSGSNAVVAKAMKALTENTEYNIVVVFASDKDGNSIENWVNGMITFKTPEVFNVTEVVTNQPTNETPIWDLNAAPVEEVMPTSTGELSETWVSTETVATTAEALPQTWTREMLIIILAMILGLVFMYVRKRA